MPLNVIDAALAMPPAGRCAPCPLSCLMDRSRTGSCARGSESSLFTLRVAVCWSRPSCGRRAAKTPFRSLGGVRDDRGSWRERSLLELVADELWATVGSRYCPAASLRAADWLQSQHTFSAILGVVIARGDE
jgi:hypothetical protein